MKLLKKEQEVKEAREKANQLEKELIDSLRNQFVDLPYELKEVETNYLGDRSSINRIKVYYPILNTSAGFRKENEKFYRFYANCLSHEYTLIDEEGNEIKIIENVTFKDKLYKDESEETYISLDFYIIGEVIEYRIKILEEVHTLKRNFDYKQLLNEIVGKENIARYMDRFSINTYNQAEEQYQKFLKELGIKDEPPTLKELAKNVGEKEIQITDLIKAVISTEVDIGYQDCIWLTNPKYNVRLQYVKYYKTTIKVKPYLSKTIEIAEKEFCYSEIENEEELRKGKTLDEIIELLDLLQSK